ncbi:lysylphosphatidylglycerol synthase transmembrane domain-containing protein [Mesorhizobium sp. CAU 1732]|uniref:lysylphosphatidylglycerol synthase transmembrane domain-containing protein n=1 Tax=Mesorhizobium sp. CAU 1732 TaxID=3140358 RepID=UPI0032612B09
MRRQIAATALRVGTPVAILAILWNFLDGPHIIDRLAHTDWRWISAALLTAILQIVLSALRWQLTARALGLPLQTAYAIREYFVAQLVNQTIPGGVVGDIARAVRSRGGTTLAIAGQAVVLERASGQIAIFAVMLSGLAFVALVPSGLSLPPNAINFGVIAVAAILAIGLAWLAWKHIGLPQRLRLLASSSRHALFGRSVRLRQVLLGLAIVACNLATFAFAARATGTALSLAAAMCIIPLILTAMLLPLSIAGWGFREGAAAVLLPFAGATPEGAVAASVAFGIVILAASLPGVFWLVRRSVPTPPPVGTFREPAR